MPELVGQSYFQAKDREFLSAAFASLAHDVTLTVVRKPPSRIIQLGQTHGGAGDDGGEVVLGVLTELASTSPRLKVAELDASLEPERALSLVGEQLPATVLSSTLAQGKLVFYGVPAGHEMAALISTIVELGELGTQADAIPEEIATRVRALPEPVHLRVFVTPSCPHCPAMTRAAFQLAMYFPNVRTDVVEVQEFPELAQRYEVRGVPKTVINDKLAVMGAIPGGLLIQSIEQAAGGAPLPDDDGDAGDQADDAPIEQTE